MFWTSPVVGVAHRSVSQKGATQVAIEVPGISVLSDDSAYRLKN